MATPGHIFHFTRASSQTINGYKDRLLLRFIHQTNFCIGRGDCQDTVGSIKCSRKLPSFASYFTWHVNHHSITNFPVNFLTLLIILLFLFLLGTIYLGMSKSPSVRQISYHLHLIFRQVNLTWSSWLGKNCLRRSPCVSSI